MYVSKAAKIEIIGWVQPNVKKETYDAKQKHPAGIHANK